MAQLAQLDHLTPTGQSLSPKGASAVLPNSQGESQADGACLGQHSEKGWGLTCQSLATMSPFNPGVTGR